MPDLALIKWKESESYTDQWLKVKSLRGESGSEEYPVLAIPISKIDEINDSLVRCIGEKICQFDGEDFCENEAYTNFGYFQLELYEVDEVLNITQLIGDVAVFDIVKTFNNYLDHNGEFVLSRFIKDIQEGKVVP